MGVEEDEAAQEPSASVEALDPEITVRPTATRAPTRQGLLVQVEDSTALVELLHTSIIMEGTEVSVEAKATIATTPLALQGQTGGGVTEPWQQDLWHLATLCNTCYTWDCTISGSAVFAFSLV